MRWPLTKNILTSPKHTSAEKIFVVNSKKKTINFGIYSIINVVSTESSKKLMQVGKAQNSRNKLKTTENTRAVSATKQSIKVPMFLAWIVFLISATTQSML